MGNRASVYLAPLFGGWAEIGRVFIFVGLALAVVNAARFLTDRNGTAIAAADAAIPDPYPDRSELARFFRGGYASIYWPLTLICLGFLIGVRFHTTLWVVGLGILVLLVTALGVELVRLAHGRRGDTRIAGPTVAVILSTATLLLVGLLVTVRLVVASDPAVGLAEGLAGDAVGNGFRAVVLPMVALILVLVVMLVALKAESSRHVRDRGEPRVQWARFVRDWRERGSGHPGRRHLFALATLAVLLAAPLLDPGSDGLTFHGIATPEYGKILYIWVLAAVLADYAFGFRTRPASFKQQDGGRVSLRQFVLTRRHIIYPVVLFGLAGATSISKNDIGPMIPLFVGTLTMIAYTLHNEMSRSPDFAPRRGLSRARAGLRLTLRYSRPLWVPLVGILAIGVSVMFLTSYVHERAETWRNPWVYNWAADCAPPPAGVTLPHTPEGTEPCQQSLASAVASRRSQVAQSLAVIADGGLWGQGLQSTVSGRLPTSSTDFVLAAIWSKLGGFAVVLLAAVLTLLVAALGRIRGLSPSPAAAPAARTERLDVRPATRAQLFGVGMAGVLLGQFFFVFAATVNALPHSGITVPFLSRGGQSTIALGIGVIVAVVALYRTGSFRQSPPADAARARQSFPPRRPRVTPAGAVFALCVLLAAAITISPYSGYDQHRPFCQTREPLVAPEECSTDRIAFDQMTMELVIGGTPQYARNRSESRWEPIGTPAISLADLAGLIQVNSRNAGTLDLALTDVANGTSGTSLKNRISPRLDSDRPTPGAVELSIDPQIQRAVATALRDGERPLAGGIVVIEAETGRVLAAASAPSDLSLPEQPAKPVDSQISLEFARHHPYGLRRPDGTIDENSGGCPAIGADADQLKNCWRWSLMPRRAPEPPEAIAQRRHFVEDDPKVAAPQTTVNRALGRRYGLGSTFKIVAAPRGAVL